MAKANSVGAADLAQPKMFPQTASFMATRFYVPANTSVSDLNDDAGCLEQAARRIVQAIAMGLEDEGGSLAANPKVTVGALYGVMHLLDIADDLRSIAEEGAR